MRPAAPPACEGQSQDVTKTHTLRTGLGCGAPPRRPDGRLSRPNQRGTCPQPVCLADARGKRQAGSGRARRQRRLWTLPQGGQYGINWAATRACGYCASATLRDKMVASGQTLMARHCAAPMGPPTPCRPAIPRARSDGWVPRRDRIRIAAGRLARRAGLERHFGPPPGSSTRRRRSARRPDSSTIPRAFVRCSMPWTSWPRIPSSRVVPVRIARPAAAAGRRLISPPTPIPGISAGQGYLTKVSPGLQGPLDGRTQLDLAAALDQLAAVYWRAGFPARR